MLISGLVQWTLGHPAPSLLRERDMSIPREHSLGTHAHSGRSCVGHVHSRGKFTTPLGTCSFLSGTCSFLGLSSGHLGILRSPCPGRGTCPFLVSTPWEHAHSGRSCMGHVHSRGKFTTSLGTCSFLSGTCSFLDLSSGHLGILRSPCPGRGTCPFLVSTPWEHAQPGRSCVGHFHSWARPWVCGQQGDLLFVPDGAVPAGTADGGVLDGREALDPDSAG